MRCVLDGGLSLFRLLLWNVGVLLFVVSRVSSRVRSQIGRDFTITVASRDGVARTFVFKDRFASSRSGFDSQAIFTLTFSSGRQGVCALLAKDAVVRVMDGLASGDMLYEGDLPYLLWFYEMVMAYVPRRNRSCTKKMPDSYLKPDPANRVGNRIIREPVQLALNPDWKNAFIQRENILLWCVGEGAPVKGKVRDFKHVLAAPVPEEPNG